MSPLARGPDFCPAHAGRKPGHSPERSPHWRHWMRLYRMGPGRLSVPPSHEARSVHRALHLRTCTAKRPTGGCEDGDSATASTFCELSPRCGDSLGVNKGIGRFRRKSTVYAYYANPADWPCRKLRWSSPTRTAYLLALQQVPLLRDDRHCAELVRANLVESDTPWLEAGRLITSRGRPRPTATPARARRAAPTPPGPRPGRRAPTPACPRPRPGA